MNATERKALADTLQSELNSSPLTVKPGIPNDLLTELFEWKKERDISIEALRNLEALCRRQRKFSLKTFGPEQRVAGVLAHIRKELKEVEDSPGDSFEWADIVLLALDGAMRSGIEPEEISQVIFDKLKINQSRDWPDWRDFASDQPIEHKRVK